MPKQANRVSETSATIGSGSLDLAGAVLGHRTFGIAFGTGANTEIEYTAVHETLNEWEVGIGTYLGPQNRVQRDTPISSSNGGLKVSFSSGAKIVFVTAVAEGPRVVRAFRSTDTPLEIRAASGQTAPLLQVYHGDGAAGLMVDSGGNLRLAAGINEMLRIPQNSAGAFVAVRQDLLGSPGYTGIRLRWSGTSGTTGGIQLSEGDTDYHTLRPDTGLIDWTNQAGDTTGIKLARGLRIENVAAQISGSPAGIIAFDCLGGGGNAVWDIGPANNTGGIHSVRLGRFAHASTVLNLILLEPGTTNVRAQMTSQGLMQGGVYYIGALEDGTLNLDYISAKVGSAFNFRSGLASGTIGVFREAGGTVAARFEPSGTSSPNAETLITRQKGDARYAAISSVRFKEDIEPAVDLALTFDRLIPKRFRWGGETPEGDEREGTAGLGFIAEEVVSVLPEAGRFVRDGDRLILQSLDPLAIAAVMHAKLAEHERRLAGLEARPRTRRHLAT